MPLTKTKSRVPASKPASKLAAKPTVELKPRKPQIWTLRLYVAGQTVNSMRAVSNLRELCEARLKNRYHIEVIDILENPHMARGDQIVAIPTLVVKLPKSVRRVIGDLSTADRVLVGMALEAIDRPN
jgi:circadian clock protein KaiB